MLSRHISGQADAYVSRLSALSTGAHLGSARPALFLSCSGATEIARTLLDKTFEEAMLRSGFDRTRALAARTAMLSSANEWGRTALHDATIKYALSAGALARRNQQAPQSECCSDLMCSGHLDITLLLLSYGASMTAVDSNGQTAADLARTWAIELCGPTAPPPRPVSLAQHLAPRPCGARRSVPSRVRAACGTCACAVSLSPCVRRLESACGCSGQKTGGSQLWKLQTNTTTGLTVVWSSHGGCAEVGVGEAFVQFNSQCFG